METVVDPLVTSPAPGDVATWELPAGDGAPPVRVHGAFLGCGTSCREVHTHPRGAERAPAGSRCSACRWTELRLFRSDRFAAPGPAAIPATPKTYVLHVVGASAVPGETPRYRSTVFFTARDLVAELTRTPSHAARTVLDQATALDAPLELALLARR